MFPRNKLNPCCVNGKFDCIKKNLNNQERHDLRNWSYTANLKTLATLRKATSNGRKKERVIVRKRYLEIKAVPEWKQPEGAIWNEQHCPRICPSPFY